MSNTPPQHGGIQRVSFNGGQEETGTLQFLARSVNIDNHSPYWYRLFPIDEYIPPFQIGLNIRLPYVTGFRFSCEAPPGLEQSIVIATTGIRGNNKPIIAIFSSLDTNNDIGYSELELAANVSERVLSATGTSPLTIENIDVTLYNGVYFFIQPKSNFNITFRFDSGQTLGTFSVYNNQKILFTIPKLGQVLNIVADTPDPGPNITLNYISRPFQGYADFNIEHLGAEGANPPSLGIQKSIAATGSVSFNVAGMDNVIISFKPQLGLGNAFTDTFLYRITLANYVNAGPAPIVFSKVVRFGDGTVALLVPIFNLLQSEANTLTAIVNVSNAASITDVALHNVSNSTTFTKFSEPLPYIVTGDTALAAAANTLLTTLVNGGFIVRIVLTNRSAGQAFISIAIGNNVAPLYTILTIELNDGVPFVLELNPGIIMVTGLSTVWAINNLGVIQQVAWNIYTD